MRILQELDDHGIIEKIFIDFDQNSVKPALLANNSDDYRILQELYDHRILVKFFLYLIIILHEIDDHGNIVKIFIEFNQNSVSQPYYITIQMTIEFFKNCMTTEFL
jgi:hypothetical protein